MADAVLTLNAGSSSIKFSLFEVGATISRSPRRASMGEVEGIGTALHFIVRDLAGVIPPE
jgi:acetate kinase